MPPSSENLLLDDHPASMISWNDSQEFIKWVNGELVKLRRDGTYDRLWKKYFADVEGSLVKP